MPASKTMGTLWVVATPLGNLEDCAPRVGSCLRLADSIFAEDTRRSRILLQHLGLRKPLKSLHAHNEPARVAQVMDLLAAGGQVAYISDAGTPAISDPGAYVVAAAHRLGAKVSPVPGPSALAAALCVAGFDPGAAGTLFLGFLPAGNPGRDRALKSVEDFAGVVVLFVGPHRVVATVAALYKAAASRAICMCRELTKMHEEVFCGQVEQLVAHLAQRAPRGEYTLVLGPQVAPPLAPAADVDQQIDAALKRCLAAGISTRDAAACVAAIGSHKRRLVYARALAMAGTLA